MPARSAIDSTFNYCHSRHARLYGNLCTLCRFKGPLTLLDGFFHMHGLGKSIITRRFRNGTELSPIGQLRSYDYEFQVCA